MKERSRTPLYVDGTAIGLVGGLFARDIIDNTGYQAPVSNAGIEEPAPVFEIQPTFEIRAVLELPTQTPTPEPTATLVRTPTPRPADNFCSTPEPGKTCRIPPPPPPTPTPYPECEVAMATPENANDICIWRSQ